MEQVLPAAVMVDRISRQWPLLSLCRSPGGTALRWRYRDGVAAIGVIASISEPFCGDCNRLRITADGQAFTCLFAGQGTDLKPAMTSDHDLERAICTLNQRRQDHYSEEGRAASGAAPRAEMAYLGG